MGGLLAKVYRCTIDTTGGPQEGYWLRPIDVL